MLLTKTIHFRSHDAVLVLERYQKPSEEGVETRLKTTVTDKTTKDVLLQSDSEYPRVLVDRVNMSDFWDLVREEIVSIGTGKQDDKLKCLLLHKIQRELEP